MNKSPQFIIFDNNPAFAKSLKEKYPAGNIYELSSLWMGKLLNKSRQLAKHDNLIFLINLSVQIQNIQNFKDIFTAGKSNYSGLNGIDLLIWLRLNKFHHHCVLYSFETIQDILFRKPEKTIICSPGTSFYRLPFDPASIPFEKLKPLSDIDKLKPFLQATYSIAENRHEHANWWGVKQLYYINYIFENKRLSWAEQLNSYPEEIKDYLSKPNNQILQYLFEFEPDKTAIIANKNRVELKKGDINLWDGKLKDISKNIEVPYFFAIRALRRFLSEKMPKIVMIDDQFEIGWSDVITRMMYSGDMLEDNYQPVKIETIDENLQKKPAVKIRKYFISNNDKVELVFIAVKDSSRDKNRLVSNYNFIFTDYLKDIKFVPDLFILDLRLMNEKGKISIDNISGTEVFKSLRESDNATPVLINSASNKVASFRELIKIGADDYWIKEGIDEQKTALESIENYYLLLYKIFRLTKQEYKARQALNQLIINLNNNDSNYWWEDKEWHYQAEGLNSSTKTSKEDIRSILEDIYMQFNILLSAFTFEQMHYESGKYYFVYAGIFVNAGKIIEEVHNLRNINREVNKTSSATIIYNFRNPEGSRNDKPGRLIYDMRNIASHYNPNSVEHKRLTFNKLTDTLVKLTFYLT